MGNFWQRLMEEITNTDEILNDNSDYGGLANNVCPNPGNVGLRICMPFFKMLWKNYPPDVSPGSHAHPSSDNYHNQCAIRLGYCFIKSGVDLSSYEEPVTTEGYPRGARSLAWWLYGNYRLPTFRGTQNEFETKYSKSGTGIIFLGKYDEYSADHIDLYNKGRTGSGYYKASEVWFWELD